jgi:hypothetical protein
MPTETYTVDQVEQGKCKLLLRGFSSPREPPWSSAGSICAHSAAGASCKSSVNVIPGKQTVHLVFLVLCYKYRGRSIPESTRTSPDSTINMQAIRLAKKYPQFQQDEVFDLINRFK